MRIPRGIADASYQMIEYGVLLYMPPNKVGEGALLTIRCQQRSDFGVNSPVLFCDHIASPSRSIGRSETVKNAGGSPNISDRTRRCVG